MKKFEAHRYPVPGFLLSEDRKTSWQEPYEGCRIVAVLQDGNGILVVYEVPSGYKEPAEDWWKSVSVAGTG